jgi:hypothetical protein
MTARYALYYAPEADGALMRAANAWLGRDPYTGERLERPRVAGLDGVDLDALTEDPRHYGFHATLKAPFELAEGETEAGLVRAVEDYARGRPAFDVRLSVQALGVFLAFRLAEPSAQMQALHEDAVRLFDRFRAPLSEFDYNRRRRPGMTEAQETQLRTFGYAGIFADFRFHMTLTGAIRDEALRTRVLEALSGHFARFEGAHRATGLALFHQPDRETDFRVIARGVFAK